MAEEFEDELARGGRGGNAPDQAAAFAALAAASREKADAFLDRQATLAELQIEQLKLQNENLQKLDEFELSHLRWRRLNDQMRGFLQMMAVALGALVVIGVAATLWSASRSDGLVIETISTPPALAQHGITGATIAARLLDALSAMQEKTSSARAASSYRNNWTADIKVEIPETGLSLGQLFAYLRDWLGHEQHLTGELTETDKGYALTTRLGGQAGETVTGGDLDDLVREAAAAIFLRAEPYRYSRYVAQAEHNLAKSLAVMQATTRTGDPIDRIWAWSGIGLTLSTYGELAPALDAARRAQALDPGNPVVAGSLAAVYGRMGRNEDELREYRRAAQETSGAEAGSIAPELLPVVQDESEEIVATLLGDYGAAWQFDDAQARMPDYQGSVDSASLFEAEDRVEAHDAPPIAVPPDHFNASIAEFARGLESRNIGDWAGIIAHMNASNTENDAALMAYNDKKVDVSSYHQVVTGPQIAVAQARLGNKSEAERVLSELRPDCYDCARAHGLVAEIEGNPARASWWFARALAMGPSLPFAETDWGEMLLHAGKESAAIAMFDAAHRKSPHFADPLEMWGEALMQENRSDLALVRFEEASKYAPNWGRLHLEWGKALWWSGNKQTARHQFAIASALALSATDKKALVDENSWH